MDGDRTGGIAERRQRGVREAMTIAGSLLLVPTVALGVLSVSWSPTRVLAPLFAAPGTIFTAEGATDDGRITLAPARNVAAALSFIFPARNRLIHPALTSPSPVTPENSEMPRVEDGSHHIARAVSEPTRDAAADPAAGTDTQHEAGEATEGSSEPDSAGGPRGGEEEPAPPGSDEDADEDAAARDTGGKRGGRGNRETPGGDAGSGNANGSDQGNRGERGRDDKPGQGHVADEGETGEAEGKGGGQGSPGGDGAPAPAEGQPDRENTGHVDHGHTDTGKPDARDVNASARGSRA